MKTQLNRVVRFFIFGILGFSLLSFVVCYFVFSSKYPETFQWYEGLWSIVSVLLVFLATKIADYFSGRSEKFLILSMCILEIFLSFLLNITYNTIPCSDYRAIWQAATQMANNTFIDGIDPQTYMYYFNWQLGMAAFESLVIRLFGDSFTVTKILNTIIVCAIDYCVYSLCKRKTSKQTARRAYVTATLFLPWVLSLPQLTNHHVAILLWFACMFALEKNNVFSWGVAGLCAGILNVFRPYGILIVLSALCWTIYLLFSRKKYAVILFQFFVFLAMYVVACACFDSLFIFLNYTDAPISQARVPYYKFQIGMTDYRNTDLGEYQYDYSLYNTAMKEELLTAITNNPKDVIIYIANKMVRYLGLFDYQFEMTYNHDVAFYQTYPVRALYCISWFQYIILLCFACKGYKLYNKVHEVDIYQIFFIGNTLVYIFIEAFSSYRFESYPLFLVFAAIGISSFVTPKDHNVINSDML